MATLIVSPADLSDRQLDAAQGFPLETPEPPGPSAQNIKALQFANTAVLALLFAAPALMCVRAACVNDPDIWWHLRTGQWIAQHRAVPRVDLFSAANAGKPWQPYSWLFELLCFRLFQQFGLPGIVACSAGMVLAITVAMRHLIKRLQSDFSVIALLTFSSCYCLGALFTPRPWLFTILFFILEMDILMQARKTGRTRELLWLPVIFVLWSNLHIQFIDGLVVLGIAVAESIATRWGFGERTLLRPRWLIAAAVASLAAACINPFGWHIYRVAYDLASQSGVMDKIQELQAIPFRDLPNYCLLFLALAAAAALAWTRRLRLFETSLLVFAAVVSFRSQRDIWVMATIAATILASTIVIQNRNLITLPKFGTAFATAAAILAVLAGFRVFHVNQVALEAQIAKTLPAAAVKSIQANGYAGPLYNDFDWGGYLIWKLQMPVSIDGRAAFYGDRVINRSVATWNAEPDWQSDRNLSAAGLVIGPVKAPLTQILRLDPHFKLVFEDKTAAVFVARK